MGTDDLFKRKRENQRQRKFDLKMPKPNSFLIVTEGARTEPLYFEGLSCYIKEKYDGNIKVTPLIRVQGEGKCTVSLVNEAEKIVNRSAMMYDQVWVVFDQDDFDDFDEAIDLAEKNNYHAAWSNQCFEYWLYLHFHYSDSALHRQQWMKKLSEVFRECNVGSGKYEKNLEDLFNLVTQNRGLGTAIQNAQKIKNQYGKHELPSDCDPCTTVHELILALKPYLRDLL